MLILGIGGTARPESSSERALVRALQTARSMGCDVAMLSGADIDVPMYSPQGQVLSGNTARLVELMRACDGLIISSPAYHGSVSGLVKNALDYAEELRDDDRPYFDGRAVGCIATANGWQGANAALVALRSIVHALRGWPTPLGAAINTGGASTSDSEAQVDLIARQVVEFARSAYATRQHFTSPAPLKLAHSRH
ncbi:MAG: NADPH-dependent oxidoreductase [Alphaproteobacteria bacterium]|nr:MAG: NADPH-dependent oxidoreductase [Alphaproteobacteria bacterium]